VLLRGASRGGAGLRRPGDGASLPGSSVRRAARAERFWSRRASKPGAVVRSRSRVGSTRYESPRESAHLATGGPTTDLHHAKVRVHRGRAGESQRVRRSPGSRSSATGERGHAPRGEWPPPGLVRVPDGRRFDVSRLRGPARLVPHGTGCAKGREARGAAERGHGQDAPSAKRPARAWTGLAAGAGRAREARFELGRRSTVMRRVRSTRRIDGSWVREPRRRSPDRGLQPRWLGARWLTWHEAQRLPCGSTRETEPRTVVE
jgi:hypothetical protein